LGLCSCRYGAPSRVAFGIGDVEPVGLLRQTQDEFAGKRLEEADVAGRVAFFGTGELPGFAGPVYGVDYFDSAGGPAFGGDVIHFIIENYVSFGVEDERFLMLVVSGAAPDEDFVGTGLEPADGGILRLLFFEVVSPDEPRKGYYLDLVCAFFEHHHLQARQLRLNVGDEDAVGVVAAFDCTGDKPAVRREYGYAKDLVFAVAVEVGQAGAVMSAGDKAVRRPEGLAAFEQILDCVRGQVSSRAVAGFVRGLQQDIVVFASLSLPVPRKSAIIASSQRAAPSGTGGLAVASSLPVAPSTTWSTESFVR